MKKGILGCRNGKAEAKAKGRLIGKKKIIKGELDANGIALFTCYLRAHSRVDSSSDIIHERCDIRVTWACLLEVSEFPFLT